MNNDVRGYYAFLGIPPTASAREIKAAYRRLAKIYHPDTTDSPSARADFHRLSDAYRVLGDAARRADYDSLSYKGPEKPVRGTRIEPITCVACGKVTAQPRYLVFRQVVSFILATTRTPVQGLYCSQCARKAALKATAVSCIFGWWGVPWGPVFTITEGIRNGFGGDRAHANEEQLLWHNAVAFLSCGNFSVAYALAGRLEDSGDPEIAKNASLMRAYIIATEPGQRDIRLKNVWRPSIGHVLAHFLMIAAAPAAAAALIYASEDDSSSSSYQAAPMEVADYTSPPPSQLSSELPAPKPTPEPLPTCDNPPENGAILERDGEVGGDEGHALEIRNGSGGDAIIKMRYVSNNSLLASFYVANQQTASLTGIPDGTYLVQYAFGDALDQTCKAFNSIKTAGEFPDRDALTTEYDGSYVRWTRMGYTLYAVPSGTVRPITIDAAAFDAN